jgi:hypothetical protein
LHPPVCHIPLVVQVCVSVPQLPHATTFGSDGAQTPTHVPESHTCSKQTVNSESETRSAPHCTMFDTLPHTFAPGLAAAHAGSMAAHIP